MQYTHIVPARFCSRPNRFIAEVELPDGSRERVHVKNTGRCRELLVPGARIYLEGAAHPARKTRFDLVAVEKGSRLINMDAQAPNRVFGEWARTGGYIPLPRSLTRCARSFGCGERYRLTGVTEIPWFVFFAKIQKKAE